MRFMLFARMFRIAQKWSEQSWISELSKDEQSLSVLLQIEQKKWKTFLQNYARSWWEPKEIEMSMFCWKKSCLMISMNFYDFYEFYEALLFLASSLLFCYFFACFLVFERRNASQYLAIIFASFNTISRNLTMFEIKALIHQRPRHNHVLLAPLLCPMSPIASIS